MNSSRIKAFFFSLTRLYIYILQVLELQVHPTYIKGVTEPFTSERRTMGLISEQYVQQKAVRTAIFTHGLAFINLDVTVRLAQISSQV